MQNGYTFWNLNVSKFCRIEDSRYVFSVVFVNLAFSPQFVQGLQTKILTSFCRQKNISSLLGAILSNFFVRNLKTTEENFLVKNGKTHRALKNCFY